MADFYTSHSLSFCGKGVIWGIEDKVPSTVCHLREVDLRLSEYPRTKLQVAEARYSWWTQIYFA